MSARQYAEWKAEYELQPWGPGRDDARALFSAVAALAPYRKTSRPLETKPFFPHLFEAETVYQSDEEMMLAAQMWTVVKGGKVVSG